MYYLWVGPVKEYKCLFSRTKRGDIIAPFYRPVNDCIVNVQWNFIFYFYLVLLKYLLVLIK